MLLCFISAWTSASCLCRCTPCGMLLTCVQSCCEPCPDTALTQRALTQPCPLTAGHLLRRRRRLREAAYRDQALLPPGKRSKASPSSSAQLSSADSSSPYCTGKSLACHGKGDAAVTLAAPASTQATQDSESTDWSERNSEQTVTGALCWLLETALALQLVAQRLDMHYASQCSGRAPAHRGLRPQASSADRTVPPVVLLPPC